MNIQDLDTKQIIQELIKRKKEVKYLLSTERLEIKEYQFNKALETPKYTIIQKVIEEGRTLVLVFPNFEGSPE